MTRFRKLIDLWKLLARDMRGASAIEYAIIATGIAVFVVIAWTFAGTQLSNTFQDIAGGFTGNVPSAAQAADSGGAGGGSSNNDSDSDFDND